MTKPKNKRAPKKAGQRQELDISMNQVEKALFGAIGVTQRQLAAQAETLARIEKLLMEK